MRKVIINENEKGFLFKDGKYIKTLNAGKYYEIGGRTIETVSTEDPVRSERCSLETILNDRNIADVISTVEIGDMNIALHFVNGKFKEILPTGKYAFWSDVDRHDFTLVDISMPEVSDDIPEYVFSKSTSVFYTKIVVAEYQKARLFIDQKFVKTLDAGTYYFWKNGMSVYTDAVDTRLTQMNITGQEILTKDKVSLRVSFVCNYRITDYVKILTEIDNFAEQIHIAAQLYMREYIGKYTLDEILESKEQMTKYVFEKLKAKAAELYVEITDAGVKDIILPGEIREIMNTVLVAEKKAQANVITRREEVASTRSLLNTAKLMEENKTLYKLKELEFIERICDNVGSINLNGNGDILSQLANILKGSA